MNNPKELYPERIRLLNKIINDLDHLKLFYDTGEAQAIMSAIFSLETELENNLLQAYKHDMIKIEGSDNDV